MIPFHERVKNLFEHLQTSPHRFASDHGLNRVSMYNMLSPDKKPGLETLERICLAEPRISAEYLIRGTGEPLLTERQTANLSTADELRSFKAEMVRSLDQRIAEIEAQTNG